MCKVRLLQRFLSQNWQCAVCSVSCVWYLVHRCAVCVQCLMCTDVQCVLCEVHRCAARHTLVLVASCITLSCALKHLLYKSVFVCVFVSVYVYFYLYPSLPVKCLVGTFCTETFPSNHSSNPNSCWGSNIALIQVCLLLHLLHQPLLLSATKTSHQSFKIETIIILFYEKCKVQKLQLW